MVEEIDPRILRKYEIVQKLGKGAYGVVWKAIDRKQKQLVALKKVFDAFHNRSDAKRTFREVMYLKQIDHENIIGLLHVYKAENNKDLYLVFEFMESDLHSVIRANVLEESHKKFIIYQILKGIKYLHSGDLVHRDLKPSNILMNVDCKAKIADFGLARSLLYQDQDNSEPIYTEYVATRWYRAPELLLGATKYTKAIDMWSVGCILGEIVLGKAVFPGTSTLNQIERIMDLIGKPKIEDIESLGSELAENIINSINVSKKKSFNQFFPNVNEDALDLLQKLFIFKPGSRLTVEEALKHRYLKEFSNPGKEPVCESTINIQFQQDDREVEITDYRDALYTYIRKQKKYEKRKDLKNQGVAKDFLIESSFLKEEQKESQMTINNYNNNLSKSLMGIIKNPSTMKPDPTQSNNNNFNPNTSYINSKDSSALLRTEGKPLLNFSPDVKSGPVITNTNVHLKQQKSASISKYDQSKAPLEISTGPPKKKSNFLSKSPLIVGIVKKFKKKAKEEEEK